MPIILSQFIHACRWAGALLVLGVHASNVFVNLSDIMSAPHSPAAFAWWFVFSVGMSHQAVVGFFVLSGYLVGGAVLSCLKKRQPFLQEYLIHRFARIYIVLAPAIALTFLLDTVGRAAFAGFYELPLFQGHFGPGPFLGTLLNLQEIRFGYFGTNGPLWSLACEFWYYVTFPLLLLPFARMYSPLARAAGFALGLALLAFLSIPASFFLPGYALWALGAFATLAPRPFVRSRLVSLALFIAVLIPVRLLVRGPYLEALPLLQNLADLAAALAFANLLISIRFGPHEGWSLFRPRLHERLADFSFSLYSIHMPVVILARAAAGHAFGEDWVRALATPRHWAIMAAATLVTAVAAFGFARLTEAHTSAARRAIREALRRFELARGPKTPPDATLGQDAQPAMVRAPSAHGAPS